MADPFFINLNVGDLSRFAEEMRAEIEDRLEWEAQNLAIMTYSRIVEQVQSKLHSTRQAYLDALQMPFEEKQGVWVVKLNPEAMWIEEGMDRHEMVDDLLYGKRGSRPYTAKDGSVYKIIPFKINKAPNASTPSLKEIQKLVRKELKSQGITYGKVERDDQGNPKQGTLHKLNIMDKPIKTMEGSGQGRGPIGAVKQGTTGTPWLQGINVMQHTMNTPGGIYTSRDVMTFRIVSSKHKGTGKWIHPGIQPYRFFDDAYNWAKNQWESSIKPQVQKKYQQP